MRSTAGHQVFQLSEAAGLLLGDRTDARRGRAELVQHDGGTPLRNTASTIMPFQVNWTVHQIRFNQVLPNLALARLIRRHRSVSEHESGNACGR